MEEHRLWVSLSALGDGNVFAVLPQLVREMLAGGDADASTEDGFADIVLPSDDAWQNKIYYKLVERQRMGGGQEETCQDISRMSLWSLPSNLNDGDPSNMSGPSGSETSTHVSDDDRMSLHDCDCKSPSRTSRSSTGSLQTSRSRSKYEFVFARCKDGYYRPGSIIGRSKKLKELIVFYYHDNSCCSMKPRDVLVRHGNLIDQQALFFTEGRWKKGKVIGNNSPAHHGFPRTFFIKKKDKWFRVNFRSMLLTSRQVFKISCAKRRKNWGQGDGQRERRVKFSMDHCECDKICNK